MEAKKGNRRLSVLLLKSERMNDMSENTFEAMKKLSDEQLEKSAGGSHISYIICCTCGRQIPIRTPSLNYNRCPYCNGKARNI